MWIEPTAFRLETPRRSKGETPAPQAGRPGSSPGRGIHIEGEVADGAAPVSKTGEARLGQGFESSAFCLCLVMMPERLGMGRPCCL